MNFIKGFNNNVWRVQHPIYTEATGSMFTPDELHDASKTVAKTVYDYLKVQSQVGGSMLNLYTLLLQQLTMLRSFSAVHGFKDVDGKLLFGDSGGFDIQILVDGEHLLTVSCDSSFISAVGGGLYVNGFIVNYNSRAMQWRSESCVNRLETSGGTYLERVECSDQHISLQILRSLCPYALVQSVNGTAYIATGITTSAEMDGVEIFTLNGNNVLEKQGRILRITGTSVAREASTRANLLLRKSLSTPSTSFALNDAAVRYGAVQSQLSDMNFLCANTGTDGSVIKMAELLTASAYYVSGPLINSSEDIDKVNRCALDAIAGAGRASFRLEDDDVRSAYLAGLNTLAQVSNLSHIVFTEAGERPIGAYPSSREIPSPYRLSESIYTTKEVAPSCITLDFEEVTNLELVSAANLEDDAKEALKELKAEKSNLEEQIASLNATQIAEDLKLAQSDWEAAGNDVADAWTNSTIASAAARAVLTQISKILAYPINVGPYGISMGIVGDFVKIDEKWQTCTFDNSSFSNYILTGNTTSRSWFCFCTWRKQEGDTSATTRWSNYSRQEKSVIKYDTPTRYGPRYLRADTNTFNNLGLGNVGIVGNQVKFKQTIKQGSKTRTVIPNEKWFYYAYQSSDCRGALTYIASYIQKLLPMVSTAGAGMAILGDAEERLKQCGRRRAEAVAAYENLDSLLKQLASVKAHIVYWDQYLAVDWSQMQVNQFSSEPIEKPEAYVTAEAAYEKAQEAYVEAQQSGKSTTKLESARNTALEELNALNTVYRPLTEFASRKATNALRLVQFNNVTDSETSTQIEELRLRYSEVRTKLQIAERRVTDCEERIEEEKAKENTAEIQLLEASKKEAETEVEKLKAERLGSIKGLVKWEARKTIIAENFNGLKIDADGLSVSSKSTCRFVPPGWDNPEIAELKKEYFGDTEPAEITTLPIEFVEEVEAKMGEDAIPYILNHTTVTGLGYQAVVFMRLLPFVEGEKDDLEDADIVINEGFEVVEGEESSPEYTIKRRVSHRIQYIAVDYQYESVQSAMTTKRPYIALPGYYLPLTTLIAMVYEVVSQDRLRSEHLLAILASLDVTDLVQLRSVVDSLPLTEREKLVLKGFITAVENREDQAVILNTDWQNYRSDQDMAFLPFYAFDRTNVSYATFFAQIAVSGNLKDLVPKYQYRAYNHETRSYEKTATEIENTACSAVVLRRLTCCSVKL